MIPKFSKYSVGIISFAVIFSFSGCVDQMDEKIEQPSEEKTVVKSATIYAEVMLEDNEDRGIYFPTQKLIGLKTNGTKVVILGNANDVLPISEYGQKQGRNKESDNLYAEPFIYSFNTREQKVYFVQCQDGTEICGQIYAYDLSSGQIKTLQPVLSEKYTFSYNSYYEISPDGSKVAAYSREDIRVFDLVKNEEIFLLKVEDIDGVLAVDPVTDIPTNEYRKLFQWTSPNSLEYPVYEKTGSEYAYRLETVETVNLN